MTVTEIAGAVRGLYVAPGWSPSGLCHKVATRLAAELARRGHDAKVVSGKFFVADDEWFYHTWVEVGTDVLDATRNQYPGHPADVLFGPKAGLPEYRPF